MGGEPRQVGIQVKEGSRGKQIRDCRHGHTAIQPTLEFETVRGLYYRVETATPLEPIPDSFFKDRLRSAVTADQRICYL